MKNAGLDEAQAGIKIARRNINNLRYANDNHCNGRKWRRTKEPLDEGEREEWKAGFKLDNQKTNIIVPGTITSWQIEGEKLETVTDFILLDSKITEDGDCSQEIKDACSLEGEIRQT